MSREPPARRAARRGAHVGRARIGSLVALVIVTGFGGRLARAQSCCAGAAVVSPGRLAPYEDALVGMQARVASLVGSHDPHGRYVASPPGTSEADFEQDLVGAVRPFRRAQLSAWVPLIETRRRAGAVTDVGAGLGDVNVAGRYDFTGAGASSTWPGIAALVGVTLPTGTPPDRATHVLAADATGIGALQASLGLAAEQTFGAWLVSPSVLVAQRAPRTAQGVHTTLGTQATIVAAVGYAFPNDAALALIVAHTREADARVDGAVVDGSGHIATTLALGGLWPLSDRWRLQGSVSTDPPIDRLGRNQPAALGAALTLLRVWS